MYVHEYQAKKILRNFGLRTPTGIVVSSKKAAASALKKIKAFPIIIKAQVHAGGRKKSGGIQTANSLADARKKINDMIGTKIINEQTGKEGRIIKKVYLEEAVAIKQEYYLSLVVDRAAAQLTFIASAAGGVAIEEVAQQNPEKIIKVPVNIATDVQDFHVRKVFFALGLNAEQFPELHKVMHGIYNAFISTDASQIEINPLVLDATNKLIVLDAKINFDDNALYRQKAIAKLADKSEKTPEEKMAAQCKLNFIQMHGNIGCMVNGAGLAMATMDLIKQYGGNPANFLDVGGEATVQTVSKALEIICKQKAVQTILVNIFGGIVKADIIADGIIDMLPKLKNPPSIVIRLLGTNAELAKAKLAKTPYKIVFTDNIEEAAREAVKHSTTVSSTCQF